MPRLASLQPCIAVFGTASDVGKSVITTALCRIFHNQGWKVAPFKAQNMSNNSFVSLSQGELARAQAVQAEAARVEPSVDMNPVLLKPSSDQVAQVIIRGQVAGNRTARDYFGDTQSLRQLATESLDRVRSQYDLVVIEGAGSCAEVNLRANDFTNFEMAHHADAPVLLVADIDRGGVFAQIIGTLEVLEPRDRNRIKGILINRFRGDARLFDDGIHYIERRTGLPVLGVIPFFSDIQIDSEDGLPLHARIDPPMEPSADVRVQGVANSKGLFIGVILLPHISNFTDFNPLEQAGVSELHYLRTPRDLAQYDLVLIPGSKNVRADLNWIHETGWTEKLQRYRNRGGKIGGICGGYQILGEEVSDPHGIEGAPGTTPGLGMLPVVTTLQPHKKLHRVRGFWLSSGCAVAGYEIHHGESHKTAQCDSLLQITERNGSALAAEDGAISADGRVWGCYLHGLFDVPEFRRAFLNRMGAEVNALVAMDTSTNVGSFDFRQRQYDLLADHFLRYVDFKKLLAAVGLS